MASDDGPNPSDVYDDSTFVVDEDSSSDSDVDFDSDSALKDVIVEVEKDYKIDATYGQIYGKESLKKCQKLTQISKNYLDTLFQRVDLESVDLSILFANGNQFFIDGESLIYEILKNPTHEHGQVLHFFFLLESIVFRFTSKDAKFSVVFFDDWIPVWRKYDSMPSLVLHLRKLAKHHLQSVLNIPVYQMDNCWDPKWIEVVSSCPMAFLLVSMGNFGQKKVSEHSEGSRALKWAFRHHWVAFLTQGIDCCRFQPRTVSMNKIFSWYAPAAQARGGKRYAKVIPQFWNLLVENLDALVSSNQPVMPTDISSRLNFWTFIVEALFPNIEAEELGFAELLLVHAHLLAYLPLENRPLTLSSAELAFSRCDHFTKFIDKLYTTAASSSNYHEIQWTSPCEQVDQLDLRLLVKLCWLEPINFDDLPDAGVLWSAHGRVFQTNSDGLLYNSVLADYRQSFLNNLGPLDPIATEDETAIKWYPVDIPDLRDIVKDVKLGEEEDYLKKEEAFTGKWNKFQDKFHWNAIKPLSDDYDRTHETFSNIPPSDRKQKKQWEKGRVLYMRHMQVSGESLEGPSSQFRPIITQSQTSGKKEETAASNKKADTKKPHQHSGGGKKAGKPMSKKDAIIAKNTERLEQERDLPRDRDAWKTCLDDAKSMTLELALVRLDTFVGVASTLEYKMKAYREVVHRCRSAWDQLNVEINWSSLSSEAAFLASRVFNMARILGTNFSDAADKHADTWTDVISTLKLMGFPYAAWSLLQHRKTVACSKNTTGDTEDDWEKFRLREIRFQFEWMGALLSRLDRQDRDPRVEHFIPDTWQRDLLDVVDKRHSALVVAPTSSGKTYVSYYCMEQILRESDDGVVVYVSPSKALVNQVAATVYARFASKRMPPGRAVLGTFTRDYRQDAMNCQILVTVPECLAILVLSPSRDDWVKKLRYIIFDEVHTLGEENTGLVWERLLNIVNCPFLALSATVSNAEDLQKWMQSVQPHIPVHCIQHSERYCDLKKMAVAVRDGDLELRGIHPLKALANPLLEKSTCVQKLPTNIDMSPSEVLQVYDVLISVIKSHGIEMLPSLNSLEHYFSDDVFVSRPKVRHFLKYMLDYIGENNLTTEVVNELPEGAFSRQSERLQELEDVTSDTTLTLTNRQARLVSYVTKLVTLLQKEKLLPAILFLDNRTEIEMIATVMTKWFERKELRFFSNDKNRTAMIADIRKQEKAAKKKTDKMTKLEKEEQLKNADEMPVNTFLNVPHPECTLAGRLAGKDKDYIFQQRLRFLSETHIFKRCLSRGIAYHHAGLNAKMRTAVEGLFRRRYLQLVSATGTLAVGIHMPCKTAVFFKDSVWLSPLQYHQRSGRAGRRGFDLVGNVLFCSMEQHRIRHLLTANLPSLKGDFTLDFSFVLRLLMLLQSNENRDRAIHAIRKLVDCPFVSVTQPRMCDQVKIFFQFAVQVLVDCEIIDLSGTPKSLAPYISHLSHHNPYNLLFAVFLRNGLFHQLCSESDDSNRSINLITVLAYIFGRIELNLSQKEDYLNDCLERKESLVIMPELPLGFLEVAQDYIAHLRQLIKQYCSVTINQLNSGHALPISGFRPTTEKTPNGSCQSWSLLTNLSKSNLQDASVTPISCLAGASLSRLVDKALDEDPLELWAMGLYVDPNMLPRMAPNDLLNSYALDFLRHGFKDHLIKENWIKTGSVFDILKDFKITLNTLAQSTKEMTSLRDDIVFKALDILSKQFNDSFEAAFPRTMYHVV